MGVIPKQSTMSDQSSERRDTTVLNHLIDIKSGLAENTAETKALTDQVRTLNGKVAGHESRLQSLESDKAVNAYRNSSVEKTADGRTELFRRWTDRVAWGIFILFLLLFYYLLTHVGFPDFIN